MTSKPKAVKACTHGSPGIHIVQTCRARGRGERSVRNPAFKVAPGGPAGGELFLKRLINSIYSAYASGGSLFEKSSAKTFRLHRLLSPSPLGLGDKRRCVLDKSNTVGKPALSNESKSISKPVCQTFQKFGPRQGRRRRL